MKPSKWTRLLLGASLLAAFCLFQGSMDHASRCVFCILEQGAGGGYLEVHNNTIYNIQVIFQNSNGYSGPYTITGNPTFMRKYLGSGTYRVRVAVCTPTPDQTPVYYRHYIVSVPDEYQTTTLTVTTPLGYIPIPK